MPSGREVWGNFPVCACFFLEPWLRPFFLASPRVVQRFVNPSRRVPNSSDRPHEQLSFPQLDLQLSSLQRPSTGPRQFRSATPNFRNTRLSNRTAARGTRTASGTSTRDSQVLHKTTATPGEQQPAHPKAGKPPETKETTETKSWEQPGHQRGELGFGF